MHNLRRCTDVVIKPADKGGAVVVWASPLYIQVAQKQLSDQRFYKKLSTDPLQDYEQKVKSTVNEMIAMSALPLSAKNLVVTTPRASSFYLLPKIHKPNNPGRPILSTCSCPTENISAYLEVLAPFVKVSPPMLKTLTMHSTSLTHSDLIPLLQVITFFSPWT